MRMKKKFPFRTIHNSSSRCLWEAVDKLFQRTLEWKIMHNFSLMLPFQSYQTLILDEKPSTCLDVRLPPDAYRMQL